jgi:hypothetical protein
MSTPNSAATPAPGGTGNLTELSADQVLKAKAVLRSATATPEDKLAARATLDKAIAAGGRLKDFASGAGQALAAVTFSGFTFGLLEIDGPKVTCQTLPTTNMATPPSTNGSINETHIPSAYVKGDDTTLTVQDDPTVVAPVGTQNTLTIVSGPTAQSRSGLATLKSYTPHKPLDGKVMTATAVFEHSGAFA